MNDHRDTASELTGVRPAAFPTAQRRIAFVPRGGYAHDDTALKEAWLRWGGETEFVHYPDRAGECGICLFTRGALGTNNQLAVHVQPFFERHGLEANVFEYDPPAQTFRRISPEWLATYYPT